jgi:hypothetical protein
MLTTFQTIAAALDGFKMYIVAGTILLAVFVEKGMGWDIPGVVIGDDWMNYVWVALGMGATRIAIKKVEM